MCIVSALNSILEAVLNREDQVEHVSFLWVGTNRCVSVTCMKILPMCLTQNRQKCHTCSFWSNRLNWPASWTKCLKIVISVLRYSSKSQSHDKKLGNHFPSLPLITCNRNKHSSTCLPEIIPQPSAIVRPTCFHGYYGVSLERFKVRPLKVQVYANSKPRRGSSLRKFQAASRAQ